MKKKTAARKPLSEKQLVHRLRLKARAGHSRHAAAEALAISYERLRYLAEKYSLHFIDARKTAAKTHPGASKTAKPAARKALAKKVSAPKARTKESSKPRHKVATPDASQALFARQAATITRNRRENYLSRPAPRQTPRGPKIANGKMLEREEETNLIRAWQKHNKPLARTQLMKAHEGLVKARAAEVARKSGLHSEIEALRQEARIAFLSALDRFDPTQKARLATYANFSIKEALYRFVMDNHSQMRIGTNHPDKKTFFAFRRERNAIFAENDRDYLTDADRILIADRIGVDVEVVKRMEPRLLNQDFSLDGPRPTEDDDFGPAFNQHGDAAVFYQQVMGEMSALVTTPEDIVMTGEIQSRREEALALIREMLDEDDMVLLVGDDNEEEAGRASLSERGRRLGMTRKQVRLRVERKRTLLVRHLAAAGLAPENILEA